VAVVVVELHGTALEVTNDGVRPIWELHAQSRGRRVEQPDGLVFGRWKLQASTGGFNSLLVPNFSLDFDDVGQI
jgi:hypothetical protein